MSSTNKTPNYELSQYVGTDKPTYLGDYNSDMLKIDEQMKVNNDSATDAVAKAGEALTKATTAQNGLSNLSARVNITEGDITQLKNTVVTQGQNITDTTKKAEDANTLATEARSTANEALNVANNAKLKELTNVTNVNSKIHLDDARPIMVSSSDGVGLLVLSGGFDINQTVTDGEILFTLPSTIKRPLQERVLGFAGFSFAYYESQKGFNYCAPQQLKIDTNGNVKCSGTMNAGFAFWSQNVFDTTGWY